MRSFIFVADVGEVTQLFTEHDANDALEHGAARATSSTSTRTPTSGARSSAFHRDYLSAVNKRTTVIVLGDARNNYNLPHEWVLKDVQQRAKQVIWLNPENRMTWGFGDSEMDRYAPYCTVVEECRNLNQLYRVIDRLVDRLSAAALTSQRACFMMPGRSDHESRELHPDDRRRADARSGHEDADRHPARPRQQAEPADLDRPARGDGDGRPSSRASRWRGR